MSITLTEFLILLIWNSPGKTTNRSRSQPPTPGGREKVTQIHVCIANKQTHDKHKDQLPIPKAK